MSKLRKIGYGIKSRWKVLKAMPKTYSNIKMLISASSDHVRFILESRYRSRINRVKADIMYISLINRVENDSIELYGYIKEIRYLNGCTSASANDYLESDGIVSRIKALNMMMFKLYERDDVSVRGIRDIINVPGLSLSLYEEMVIAIPKMSVEYDKWVKGGRNSARDIR